MSPTSISTIVSGVPAAPLALTRWLAAADGVRTSRTLQKALSADNDVAPIFVRFARAALPGRRIGSVADAVPLLREAQSTRLLLVSAVGHWLASILHDDPALPALLRHSIAAAVASEPLGRDTGVVDPQHAFLLGLLHHLGDAVLLRSHVARSDAAEAPSGAEIAAELLRAAGAPDAISRGLHEYQDFGRGRSKLLLESRVLAAADYAATELGYAAPVVCGAPALDELVKSAATELRRERARLVRAIEDFLAPMTETVRGRHGPLPESRGPSNQSPVVTGDILDGVSTRDLGPLAVLFSRIAAARDFEAVVVALTGGLVEELELTRAWFMRLEDDGVLKGGILCCRGNVPLPLHAFVLHLEHLPRQARTALSTGRPIFCSGVPAGLEFLSGDPNGATWFVPVMVGKQTRGLLGVETLKEGGVSPSWLAAVTAHAELALHAAELSRLSDQAKTDELTGLWNRRGILDQLDRWLERCTAEGRPLAIALIDCDHLKKVNDNFGHLMGDEFVRTIADEVRRSLRATDELGRYGGDEFLAVLPDATLDTARVAIERARAAVEKAGFENPHGLLLSCSIGAVVRGASAASRERLLQLADFALYRVKQEGRNATLVVDAEAPPVLAG